MDILWGGMLAVGILYGILTGNLDVVTQAVLDSARSAVNLAITMAGMMAFWTGIMQIGQSSGVTGTAQRCIRPLMNWLFPDIPKGHKANEYIAANMAANILGLGWAATPAGLKAMKELKSLEKRADRATDMMCAFLVLNISSLQLIPINMIAYRSQYGSAEPASVVFPSICATALSTLAGILFIKGMELIKYYERKWRKR